MAVNNSSSSSNNCRCNHQLSCIMLLNPSHHRSHNLQFSNKINHGKVPNHKLPSPSHRSPSHLLNLHRPSHKRPCNLHPRQPHPPLHQFFQPRSQQLHEMTQFLHAVESLLRHRLRKCNLLSILQCQFHQAVWFHRHNHLCLWVREEIVWAPRVPFLSWTQRQRLIIHNFQQCPFKRRKRSLMLHRLQQPWCLHFPIQLISHFRWLLARHYRNIIIAITMRRVHSTNLETIIVQFIWIVAKSCCRPWCIPTFKTIYYRNHF